ARGLIGDAGHRGEEIFGLAPSRRATDQLADIVGKLLQLTLQDLDVAGQTLADTHIAGALLALALGDQHLDDLTPPRDQLTEQPRRLIGDRPRFGLYRFGKPRDHLGIDRIALGPFAERLREVAHLRAVG